MVDGPSITKPQVGGAPQGSSKAAVSPGNTKPAEIGQSDSPLKPGPSAAVYKGGVSSGASVFNANNYVGVDPIYRNAANTTETPTGA